MSQSPDEPRNNDLGQPEQPEDIGQTPNHAQEPRVAPSDGTLQSPETTPISNVEPTRNHERVSDSGNASDQPTDVYSRPANHVEPQPATSVYGQASEQHHSAATGSPYGSAGYGHSEPHSNYPVPPERAPKKKFAGSTLIAGMVAAALIGGVTAAGTTYFMNDGGNASSTSVQTPQNGVVINNPESVTAVTAAAAKASPSVVTIEASGNGSGGSGSGIILDTEGHILTNTHVVTLGGETANPTLSVRLSDGKVHQAKLVGTDPLSDLAVIKIDASNLVPATLGKSSALNVGDTAVAIGAPLGLSGTVTDGIISTLNRTISVASSAVPKENAQSDGNGGGDSQYNFEFPGMPKQDNQSSQGSIYINVMQTDAAINHGNSGGALVNDKGEIIGVNVAIASSGSGGAESGSIGVGFAIPIDYAQRIANEIIANGSATHGLLGATVQAQAASTGSDASQFSVGAAIQEISPNSAAEKAGLKSGDIITGVNGRAIQDSQTLTAAIREVPAGRKTDITYTRNGAEHKVSVEVGSLK
ncbi:trypsin-like peptidase domain-containing protein [Arthrobacter sp. MYb213]|uniref:S1C family serine protease n=1 Tax=Arthrobacter sp. MYb213 TaxID=1848595 RepID=UPI000CFD841A|nr:trypsin-like peptidase domain-containing protein [Arthrobacter sp. MYb213]PRB71184.1 serine protease [Arthrobacter sp. MYb213]